MSSVSSMVPPTFLTRRMSRKSTLSLSLLTRRRTESTAIGARMDEYCETILDESDVVAARKRLSRSLRSTGRAISVRNSTTLAAARVNDSAMMVGWMPLLSSFSAAPRSEPARTTTEVVPSPASMSCAAERSTSCCPRRPNQRAVRRTGDQ